MTSSEFDSLPKPNCSAGSIGQRDLSRQNDGLNERCGSRVGRSRLPVRGCRLAPGQWLGNFVSNRGSELAKE